MNKVILMGRLVRDVDLRNTSSSVVGRYTLAVNRKFAKDSEQKADFINCVVFGKAAEFASKYFHKGSQVLITGRIQTGSYTNKDGQKVYTTDVMVDEQEFAESKSSSSPAQANNQASSSQGFTNAPDFEEDLPFN